VEPKTNIEVLSLDGTSIRFPSPIDKTLRPRGPRMVSALRLPAPRSRGSELYIADANGRNITASPSGVVRDIRRFVADMESGNGPSDCICFGSQRLPANLPDERRRHEFDRLLDEGGDAEMPSWSPDGSFLAFAWKKSGTSRYDIYVQDLSTGKTLS
jgi:hypothetical protein